MYCTCSLAGRRQGPPGGYLNYQYRQTDRPLRLEPLPPHARGRGAAGKKKRMTRNVYESDVSPKKKLAQLRAAEDAEEEANRHAAVLPSQTERSGSWRVFLRRARDQATM